MTRFSLKRKCNTEAVGRFSLTKRCNICSTRCFLVISIDDEYGEEDDDDYETKDMGVHDMDGQRHGRLNQKRKRTVKDTPKKKNGRLRARQTKPKKKRTALFDDASMQLIN